MQDSMHTFQYHENLEDWVLVRRDIYSYNHQGLPEKAIQYKIIGTNWSPIQQVKYIYNSNAKLVAKETELFAFSINKWISDSCFSYEYNSIGLLQNTSVSKCRTRQPLLKQTYEYSPLDELLKEETLIWNSEHDLWRNSDRTLYSYNNLQNPITEVQQKWSEASQVWENNQMTSYTYESSGENLLQLTHQYWDEWETEWEEEEIVELEYNQKGQIIHYNRYPAQPEEGDPVETETPSSIDYTYTNQGNPVQVVIGEYNTAANSWSYIEKSEYFWSRHTAGTIQNAEDKLCFFANPYYPGGVIRCNNLKTDVDYTLRVIDQQGRTIHHQQIVNNGAFQIKSQIPPGLYFVVVSGGLDSFARKVIFANK